MFSKIIHILSIINFVLSNDIKNSNYIPKKSSSQNQKPVANRASRLGEPVLLECGAEEHQLLRKLESTDPSMPILVNWFKHYSPNRHSDKPIYAKYLANNIDYAPHISKEFENRIQVVDKINLNITSLRAVDEALYECRLILFDKAYADSLAGSMFYLQVQIAPEFEYPNEEIIYFKPNVPIRLYCYAKGKPIPSITWYKNGKYMEKNTSVLQDTLSDSEISDIFEYKCRAENDVGFIEHTTKVIRSGSLFFTETLKNLTITEGTILNWPCLAQSNTEITYKWFKDSISVESHLFKWSDRGALFQDGMLYLLETYRTDSGFYECHAFTSNKRIITSAYLNVLYGPEIEPFPSPFYAFENSRSIIIDCVIKASPSITTLEWFKDQYLISNTEKYEILANNSLLIKYPGRNDEGSYYCVCNNTIKKSVSQHVKVEFIEAKKFEKISFTTSNNEFSLPCMKDHIQPNQKNVQWFKINSKLPSNRYSIDSNGSLVLDNLRSSDAGFYYCKIKEEFAKGLSNFQEEILIKLFVKKNRSVTDLNFSSENDLELSELPLCPQNVKLNQTQNGILVTWIYPQQTPVDIEYFQIYFRELSGHRSKPANMASNKFNYEWKTTEPINFDTYKYLIDYSELEQGKTYEIQLVSFSSFSKSLPTQNFKIKYHPKSDQIKEFRSSIYAIEPTTSNYIKRFSLNSLNNLSQLDLILAAIFLILICVLAISITACVLFSQSEKSIKQYQKGDIDDWGFQSSAATTTFLSSSSSSEKSTSLDSFSQKNKLFRHPKVEYNLNNKAERKFLHDNVNILKNETNAINHEEDMFDDGDYYYAKPKLQTTTIKSRNFSYQSNSTGISSNPIDSSRSASSASSSGSSNQKSENFHSPNLINTSDATSSGITSASVTSSLINSDDYNDDMSEKSNEFSVNKIKYNAKTNKFSTQDSSKAAKMYRPGKKKYEHVLLEDNYSKILKSSLNRKQAKEVNNCLNEYSGLSLDVDASNSSSEKKNWNKASPAKSNCSIEINDSQNTVPPFPTCHFKDKLPLDSSSSLTMVSRLPTSSFSYITNQEAKKNLSSESSSSSSSGCSSMTQQVCTKHEVGKFYTLLNDKNLNKSKKKNVNFVNQRNSLCVNMDHNSKCLSPFDKKELIYSTNFKPVLKSINSAGTNLLLEESPNKYHTSTFKPNRIDYV